MSLPSCCQVGAPVVGAPVVGAPVGKAVVAPVVVPVGKAVGVPVGVLVGKTVGIDAEALPDSVKANTNSVNLNMAYTRGGGQGIYFQWRFIAYQHNLKYKV